MTKRKPEPENNFLEGGLNKALKPTVGEVATFDADDLTNITPMDIDLIVTKNRITNEDLENILNKINPKGTRTIDKDYLDGLLGALNDGGPDQAIQNKITKETFQETVLTLYLLLEYGRDELFKKLQHAIKPNQRKTKLELTYLANICCQMNDSDNFQKLTSYKDYININSTKICGANINIQPCLKLAIQHTNIDLINKILDDYGDLIDICASIGKALNVYETLLKNNDLRKTLEGLQVIQKVQEKYIEQILAKYPNPKDNQIESIAQEIKGKNGKSIIDDETIRNIVDSTNEENTPMDIEPQKTQENNIVKPTKKRSKKQSNKESYLLDLKSDLRSDNLDKLLKVIDVKNYINKESDVYSLLKILNNEVYQDVDIIELLNLIISTEKVRSDYYFTEKVITLYLLLEYGKDDLFQKLQDTILPSIIYKTKVELTYLAKTCCKMNDFDNFKKLTRYKDFININSQSINRKSHFTPCLLQVIQNKNLEMAEYILKEYANTINVDKTFGLKTPYNRLKAMASDQDSAKITDLIKLMDEIRNNDIDEISDNSFLSDIDDLYPEYTGFLGGIDKFLGDINAIEEV